jgi:hypothetical protein
MVLRRIALWVVIAAVAWAIAALVLTGCATNDPKRAVAECCTFNVCMGCLWDAVLCGYPDPPYREVFPAGEGEGE